MFNDYYKILEVDPSATQEEIKSAFKKQAIKWHPDRNIGVDTTKRMQEINEAYLILKDIEARERYNREYQRFKQYQRQNEQSDQQEQKQSEKREKQKEKTYKYADYNVKDDILKKWMDNAKKQAVDLAKQTIEDFKGMVAVGAKAAVKGARNVIVFYIIIGLIATLILGISKSCT
jgi:curved DNA-binding protein CbpA